MAYNGEDEYITGSIGNPYRRRRLIALALALVLTAAAAVAIVVITDDDEPSARRAAPSTSPSPSVEPVSESPSPSSEESPSADPSPSPEPSASASASPSASVSPSATRTPSARPTASPGRAFPAKGLVLDVVGEPISGDPPQVRFRIRVRDNDGSEVNGTINFGDGTSLVYSQRPPGACRETPSEPAPGYRAQPIDKSYTVTHAYQRGGRFTVTVTAQTQRQCEGTPAESAKQTLIVEVPNRPTPSPTPSPTFISTPSPSPSASASPSPSRT